MADPSAPAFDHGSRPLRTGVDADVLIIGAGPAGSTLATYLAREGRRVFIFERETFPRFRIGESLLPLNLEIFRDLGVEDELEKRFIRKYAANFCDHNGERMNRYPFAGALNKDFPYCYQVERAELDTVLLDNAKKAGAEVFMSWTVRDLIYEGSQVVGLVARSNDTGEERSFRAKVVADCSGRAAFAGSRNGLKREVKLDSRTAFFSHYEGAVRDPGDREGDIQIVAFPHGWFWMIPFKGNTTSVGMVVTEAYLKLRHQIAAGRPESRGKHDDSREAVGGFEGSVNDAFLAETIEATPYVRDRLKNATQKFPARSIPNYTYVMERYAADGLVMVGDAGAFIDPVFSSGVFLTMKSAQLVAKDLRRAFRQNDFSAGQFKAYEERIRAAQKIFFKFIEGWYDPAFLDLFFTPRNILGLKTGITSVLAADLFDERHLWNLKLRIELLFAISHVHRFQMKRSNGGRSRVQGMAL